ncbi:protein kinase [Frankia sp. Ag45/Mut15]|uniref:Protein kinase n=1 Tax=Frankia umida TaxID=573489 RepID=A0ABT0JVH1_9ACTN|nr:serine/threonine-protein kinase [Frankia umida]MCK9875527.1 protein kinase [Frankia umida]
MEALHPDDPESIGSYRLLARLGAGGMGRVYLGRSTGGRTVAIKVIRAEFAEESQFRHRFRREVDAARRVGGMWTAPVLDADPEAEQPWLVTAFVPGPSLQDAVRDHGPLPVHTVRALGAGLAEALISVHGAGLVHRDLKPSNVLMSLDGPRVIDFGISRAVDATVLTHSGGAVGSPAYMAPEQIGTGEISPATDIFALGIVLTYAATGAPPFRGPGLPAVMYAILSNEPDLTQVPAELRELIAACLSKDPTLRPTPTALLARLAPGRGAAAALVAAGWLPPELVTALSRSALALLDLDAPTRAHPGPPARPFPSSPSHPGVTSHPGAPTHPGPYSQPSSPAHVGSPAHPGPYSQPGASSYPGAPARPAAFAQPAPPPPPYSPTPPPPPKPSTRRTGRVVALVGAVIAVLVVLTAVLFLVLPSDGKDDPAAGDQGQSAAPSDAARPAGSAQPPASSTDPGAGSEPAATAGTGGAAVAQAYLGTWQGALSDSSGVPQNVVITVRAGRVGETVAHSEVTTNALASVTGSELRCVADMRLTAAAGSLTLQDVPGSGGTSEPTLLGLPLCAHGGTVMLRHQADGTLRYTSDVPGTSNPAGTLTRSR